MTRVPYKVIAAIIFTLLVIALWQAAVDTGVANRLFVAAPANAFGVIVERAEAGSLWTTIGATAQRLGAGWMVAVAVAILLGAAIGNSQVAYQFLSPTLEFFRPLPASAVIPVAILFFGLTTTMSTFVIAFGSLWPVLLAAIHGYANVPRELREVASTLEMSRLRYILTIATPSASVDIMAGLRISLALALILTVVTEMQASLPGLGYEIFLAQRTFRSADLYAGLMTLGIFGFLISQALLLVEARLMRWKAT
jgi:sulfonate transport system permease protein